MRITTKGRQAVIAMVDVALRQKTGPVALAGISQRRQISISYLEQMFTKLRNHGLVRSTRGPGGGYRIARPLESISVADIVGAVDSLELDKMVPRRAASASSEEQCLTPELWTSLSQRMIEFLGSVSLKKLVDEQPLTATRSEARTASDRSRAVIPSRVKSSTPNAPNSVFQLGVFPVR